MTAKKTAILKSALKSFSSKGISSTSTSQIANAAGVSEALIFRHFINKKGLLNAVKLQIEERFDEFFHSLEAEKDLKKKIQKIIQFFFSKNGDDALFLKLNARLAIEYNDFSALNTDLLYKILVNAFTKLNRSKPEQEAQFLLLFLEGLVSNFRNDDVTAELHSFILEKYELNSKS